LAIYGSGIFSRIAGQHSDCKSASPRDGLALPGGLRP
jgi:hypothetical protein